MRDALSLTDQVLSFAGSGASAEQVTDALGIIDRRSIVTAVEASIRGDAKAALAVVDNAFVRGHDQRQLLAGIAEELRHLSVAAATGSLKGFADLPDEEIARIDARSKELEPRDLTRLYSLALDGIDPVSKAEDPRLFVELVLLKMCGRPPLGDALAISEAIVRLEALAKGKPVPPLDPNRPPTRERHTEGPTDRSAPDRPSTTDTSVPRSVDTSVPRSVDAAPPRSVDSPPPRSVDTSPPRSVDEPELYGEDPPPVAEVAPTPPPPSSNDDEEADATPAPSAPVVAVAEESADDDDADDGVDPAAGLPLEGVDPRFIAFVDKVAKTHRPIAMHLDQAKVVSSTGGKVEICFLREMHAAALKGAVDAAVITDALAAAYGAGHRLVIVAPPADPKALPPSLSEARDAALQEAQRALEAHAKSHPVVEKAVALFGGQVRAVRQPGQAR